MIPHLSRRAFAGAVSALVCTPLLDTAVARAARAKTAPRSPVAPARWQGYLRSAKATGGLVCVNPPLLASVSKYGVDHYVLKVPWASIEASQGVYNWSLVDAALAQYGSARMTLRIQAGGDAPAWLKKATGTVSVTNASRGLTVNVCHWWEQLPLKTWGNMIAAAGARYDADARVVMVSADEAMTVFSEPFIMGGDAPSGARLFAAGCNEATHTAAITQSVADTMAAFPTTLVELAIHSDLQICTATGIKASKPAGRALALNLCTRWGRHLVVSDYGLSSLDTAASHTPTGTISTEVDHYAWMRLRSQGGTATWAGPTSYQLTLRNQPLTQATYQAAAQNGYDLGGCLVETSGWGMLGSLCTGVDGALKVSAAAS